MPNQDGELSVFRVHELPEEQIWEIGRQYISEPLGRTLYGRGDMSALVIIDNNLTIIPDDDPPRHANIVNWPEDKSAQKLKAIELAKQATLKVHPE